MNDDTCSARGCEKRRVSRGLCGSHYQAWRAKAGPNQCTSPVCDRPAVSRSLCQGHYARLLAGKPTDTPLQSRRNGGFACTLNEEGEKECLSCRTFLPIESYARGAGSDGLSPNCRSCRSLTRVSRYGITVRQYLEMLSDQGGVCAICAEPPQKRQLHVDHDHSCCGEGKACQKCVRGLLCSRCNTGLGQFRERSDLLASAANYLQSQNQSGRSAHGNGTIPS